MVEAPDPTTARRASILDAARRAFLRFGFKKTSMDDLARAAGLSRQGLYLHFATKEALFKETVASLIEGTRAAYKAALARTDLGVEERLVAAFEAGHGQAIGQSAAENLAELLEATATLVGPVVEELDRDMTADVARALQRAGVAAAWKRRGISAHALADNLFSTSSGVKHRARTVEEYREHMRIAVRILCHGAE